MWLLVLAALAAQATVVTEFRAFDGADDVTATTRFRVTAAGRSGTEPIETQATVSLAPAVYDVQAIRAGDGGLVAIKAAERLVVMHYPDEGGRHLEVINFQAGYGALQLKSARGPIAAYEASLFRAGERTTPAARPIAESDYLLFVVPAGRYDIRLQHAQRGGAADTHWLLRVEVPPGRTRLKIVDAAD